MTQTDLHSAFLSDPRLAEYALSPAPVWLWSADAIRILWANPTGAAIFDAVSPGAAAALRFEGHHAAAAQIARLSDTLSAGAKPRLERLHGIGASLGDTLICLCSRITLNDSSSGILVVSTERAGKNLTLSDRAERLLTDSQVPAALFSAGGELMTATPKARARLGEDLDLMALNAEAIARAATLNGYAEGVVKTGRITIRKLGAGAIYLLLVTFAPAPAEVCAPPAAAATIHVPRPPLRFIWQMDVAFRFTQGIEDFARLVGPKTAALLDRPWTEIADLLKLDPAAKMARALASHDTWSGIVVNWPTDKATAPLPIEMSGLPVLDRHRQFTGYRGFCICRDQAPLDVLEQHRAQPASTPPESKVVPLIRQPVEPAPKLSPDEHGAFQELARELSERLKKAPSLTGSPAPAAPIRREPMGAPATGTPEPQRAANDERPILDRLPAGILIYRLNTLIYANDAFLEWTGYPTLQALSKAGGLDALFIETTDVSPSDGTRGGDKGARTLTITTVNGNRKPVAGKLFSVTWNGEAALALVIQTQGSPDGDQARAAEMELYRVEAENRELKTILDTATDGVLVLDVDSRVLSANRSAEALFGYDAGQLADLMLVDLFAPESGSVVLDYFDRLMRARGAAILDAGQEAMGRTRRGDLVPISITMGHIEDGDKLCAVLRDITAWKHSEVELIHARQEAEKVTTAKSDLLAKISHEIRMPLNAIIGFSEVMMEERFGAIGNERYRQYLRDIYDSGSQLMAFINDLIELTKIEANELDLAFVNVSLNDLVRQCVTVIQDEANRERVIIRTALPASVPPIIADARSLRHIVLGILSNAINFGGAGGQVIVSTALNEMHEVVLRVRDTGTDMNEKELEALMDPFHRIATAARRGAGASGLGLRIAKALAETNCARFTIACRVEGSTLVEVTFPATRVGTIEIRAPRAGHRP